MSSITFNQIPSTLRVRGFYAEFDASRAQRGAAVSAAKALLIGQKVAGGTATTEVPVSFTTKEQAKALFGAGSILALMAETWFKNNKYSEVWAIPLADNGAGTAAAWTAVVSGPATAAGALAFYVGGVLVSVAVASGDAAATIATALNAAINANTDLPFTSAVATATVTLTAKNKGTLASAIDLRVNYDDADAYPAGVTVALTQTVAGATDPTFTNLISAMGETRYKYIVEPYLGSTQLTAIETELEDRWGPLRQNDGHAFSFKDDTFGNLATFGNSRNSKHVTSNCIRKSPTPAFCWAAACGAIAAYYLEIDPARPIHTLELVGCLAPAKVDRFLLSEMNTLLYDGLSPIEIDQFGVPHLGTQITMYKTNGAGATDTSYLSLCRKATLSAIREDWNSSWGAKYARFKLAEDGKNFGPGQPIMTPTKGKAEAIVKFKEWEEKGWVEDVDQFKADLLCEIDANNANRLNFILPPNLMNQLEVLGSQIQFRQ